MEFANQELKSPSKSSISSTLILSSRGAAFTTTGGGGVIGCGTPIGGEIGAPIGGGGAGIPAIPGGGGIAPIPGGDGITPGIGGGGLAAAGGGGVAIPGGGPAGNAGGGGIVIWVDFVFVGSAVDAGISSASAASSLIISSLSGDDGALSPTVSASSWTAGSGWF